MLNRWRRFARFDHLSRLSDNEAFRLYTPAERVTNGPFRCFVWVVLRLGNGWNGQDKFAGPVVGGGSEVDEVFESSSHSLC